MINQTINTIHKRRSIGNLTLPMPNEDELNTALTCAFSAPDHKKLKPWQVVILIDQALIEFGEVLRQAAMYQANQKGETLDEATNNKLKNLPKRAPMIIMVATNLKEHPKVPAFEQILSTGAMIQNLLLALESLGYQSIWRTGDLINEEIVKHYFNIDDKDIICGFIYVGTSNIQLPERENINLADMVSKKS